jgi:hypothetical protein
MALFEAGVYIIVLKSIKSDENKRIPSLFCAAL